MLEERGCRRESRSGLAKKLDEETNFAHWFYFMGDLGLDYTREVRMQNVLLWIWGEDSIAEATLQYTDARPNTRLG